MAPAWMHDDAWVPVTAPLQSVAGQRSAEQLLAVLRQFDVETQPRYRAHNGQTFCSTFSWDVTRALGAEIPHWVDPATGEPVAMGHGLELNANAMSDWLDAHGQAHGWAPATALEARQAANRGEPAVVIWKNPAGGPGHIALVVPGFEDGPVPIAQAGAVNFNAGALQRGFGNLPVRFFVHP